MMSESEQDLTVRAESFFKNTDEYGMLSAASFEELDDLVKNVIYERKDLSLKLLTHDEIVLEAIDYAYLPSPWRHDPDIWLMISQASVEAFDDYCPKSLIDEDFAHAVFESYILTEDDYVRWWIYKIRRLSFFRSKPEFTLRCLKTLREKNLVSSSVSFWLLDSAPKKFFKDRQFYIEVVEHIAAAFSRLNEKEDAVFGGDGVWYYWNSVIGADDVLNKLRVKEFIADGDIRSTLEQLIENLTINLDLITKFGEETFFLGYGEVDPAWKKGDSFAHNNTALEWTAAMERLLS